MGVRDLFGPLESYLRCVDEDLDQLIDSSRRLMYRMLFNQGCKVSAWFPLRCIIQKHTATSLDSLRIVVSNIVVDPSQVRIRLFGGIGRLEILQSSPDHAVAKQTRQ